MLRNKMYYCGTKRDSVVLWESMEYWRCMHWPSRENAGYCELTHNVGFSPSVSCGPRRGTMRGNSEHCAIIPRMAENVAHIIIAG